MEVSEDEDEEAKDHYGYGDDIGIDAEGADEVGEEEDLED